jgi:hypothetical protein
MCVTDATNLIHRDASDKKQTAALKALKKKLIERRRELQAHINDVDRGLKKVNKNLSRSSR